MVAVWLHSVGLPENICTEPFTCENNTFPMKTENIEEIYFLRAPKMLQMLAKKDCNQLFLTQTGLELTS